MNSPSFALFIICRDHGREVLVDRTTWTLPHLVVPCEGQLASQSHGWFATAFAENFAVDICPLFAFENSEMQPRRNANDITLRFISGSEQMVVAGECLDCSLPSTGSLQWSLAHDVKGDASDQQALTRTLQLAWDRLLKRSRTPLARFSWFAPLFAEFAIGPGGVEDTVKYHDGTESRAAFRVSRSGRTLWLKAASFADSTPKRLQQTLVHLGLPYMPAIEGFASNAPDWDAILQENVAGTPLDYDDRMESWVRAAEGIAEIQLGTIGADAHLRASGCPMWTLDHLKEEAGRLLHWLDIDIFKQQRFLPASITLELRDRVLSHLSSLAQLGIPQTLIRNSLLPIEIVADCQNQPWFVGFEDAAVGFPFIWCDLLVEAAQQRFGAHESIKSRIFEAYSMAWRRHLSDETIQCALEQVAFVRAVSEAVRAAQIPTIAVPDRFIKPDKYEWAFRLTRDGSRWRRLGDSLRKAIALATRQASAA